MARIAGVEIPNEKRIEASLRYIHGIGPTVAKRVLTATGINPDKRTKDLTDAEANKIYEFIDKNLIIEGALRQTIFRNVKRLKDIRAYRGNRHKANLPVRGQNTRKNARTRKGKKRVAVGGLNKKETK